MADIPGSDAIVVPTASIAGAVSAASYAGSLLPTGHDEEVDSYVNDTLSEHASQIDQQLRREHENQQLRLHLQYVRHQQHSIIQHFPLPVRDMYKSPFQGKPPKAPFQGSPPIPKVPLPIRDISKAPFQGQPAKAPFQGRPPKAPFQGQPPKAHP